MLLHFGKQNKQQETGLGDDQDFVGNFTTADFIPYAYHYDPHTLITKNGELVQMLRITANSSGVDYESPEPGIVALRDAIRRAINSSVSSNQFACWVHTLRRRIPIQYAPQFKEGAASDMYKAWQGKRRWQHNFNNEVYVSILRQGQSADMFDFKEISKTLVTVKNRHYREAYIEQAKEEMDATVGRIMEALVPHSNAKRLSIVERPTSDGGSAVYSEPLEMVYYLVNMQDAPVPIADIDVSRLLGNSELTFGFDAIESRSPEGKRRFAGMLTLKGSPELSPEVLDKCLQLPEEMIITQSFNYLSKKQALEKQLEAKVLLDASLDPFISLVSGVQHMIASDQGRPTDFGEQHTSITIIRDQYKVLDKSVGKVQESFAQLGLVSVREEIMLEDCYWAQMPGNFFFLRRRIPISSNRMAGLARLNHFPSGKITGNHWGNPVVILPTLLDTPYYFNFHQGDIGHTAVLDFNSFADERGTTLLNFLLTCSRQYSGKLFIFDLNHAAKPLVNALGGNYYHLLGKGDAGTAPCTLNPLQMEDSKLNRSFLAAWLGHFLKPGAALEEPTREMLKAVVEEIYALPAAERTLANAKKRLANRSAPLLDAADSARLESLFGAAGDTLDFTKAVSAVEMLNVSMHSEMTIPVFSYLMHRIVTGLDGTPTIIVLNEAWKLLDNDFFRPRLVSLLDMLRQKNTMVIFVTRHFEDYAESHLTRQILEQTATKIFVPDDIATDYFREVTGLTEREAKLLVRMERQKGHFLVKHGAEVVDCIFPQEGLEAFAKTLAGDAKALRLMQIQQR